ncbi:O80 family O-antigen flippase [Escherichia coli]|uniref:O80 family O-antigen flippase n=1 Tax=Escherichia coli TaxID=562 RepID=UPI000DD7C1DA|nr:O80 family O-antigen flippase [Escherichia coli]MCA7283244.1 O80 family O-antigen flippase [Escherichia coli]
MSKFIILFARGYEVLIAFCLLKLMSDFLSPLEYAQLNLFVAITQGIALFFISPLQNWILVNNDNIACEIGLNSTILFEFIYSSAISVVACLLLIISGTHHELINAGILYLFILAVITPVLSQTVIPILNLQGKIIQFAGLSILGATLGIIIPVSFVSLYKDDFEAWLLGGVIAQLLVIIIGLFIGNHSQSLGLFLGLKKIPYRKIFVFCLPLCVAIGFQWYNAQGFRLSLQTVVDLKTLGAFIMGFGFGGKFLNAIEKVFSTVLLPQLYNRKKDSSIKKEWLIYIFKMSAIYSVATFVIILLSQKIYPIIISEKYAEGQKYIVAGVIFDMFRCMQNAVYQYNLIVSKNHIQLIMNMCITLFVFAFIYFINKYQLEFSYFVMMLPVVMGAITLISFIRNYMDEYENS